MFTGIIEQTGRIEELRRQEGGARLALSPDREWDVELGESLCVSGVCLSLASELHGVLEFDLSDETLRRSTLGGLKPGDLVNLEKALRAGQPIGGHFVSGHVDGVGSLRRARKSAGGAEMEFSAPRDLMPLIAHKGSVAVDGVSLTPVEPTGSGFRVALVPTTLARTTLGFKREGDPVNLEIDMLARYVRRALDGGAGAGGGDGAGPGGPP